MMSGKAVRTDGHSSITRQERASRRHWLAHFRGVKAATARIQEAVRHLPTAGSGVAALREEVQRYRRLIEGHIDALTDDGHNDGGQACVLCRSRDEVGSNEINVCNWIGCNRHYHHQCLDPPIIGTSEEEDEWYCWQCQTLSQCLQHLDQALDMDWDNEEAFMSSRFPISAVPSDALKDRKRLLTGDAMHGKAAKQQTISRASTPAQGAPSCREMGDTAKVTVETPQPSSSYSMAGGDAAQGAVFQDPSGSSAAGSAGGGGDESSASPTLCCVVPSPTPSLRHGPDDMDIAEAVDMDSHATLASESIGKWRENQPLKAPRSRVVMAEGMDSGSRQAMGRGSDERVPGKALEQQEVHGSAGPKGAAAEGTKEREGSCAPKDGDSMTWQRVIQDVNKELLKTSKDRHLIESYTSGWRGGAKDKLKPEQQLREAYGKVAAMKHRLRQLLCKVAATNQHHARVATNVSIEDVACSVCGSTESWEDNDLLLCDGPGCERAYHQNCMDPYMSKDERDEMLDGDKWLCRQCECLKQCLDLINGQLGTAYAEVKGLFPELDRADGGEVWSSAEEDDDSDFQDDDMDGTDDEEGEEEEGNSEAGSDEEEEDCKVEFLAGGEEEGEGVAAEQQGTEEEDSEEDEDSEEGENTIGDSEDEESSDSEEGMGSGSASGEESDSCASVRSVDDTELQLLTRDAQMELVQGEEDDGAGPRRRRPKRSAASACKKRIDEVLGLRAKAGKGVRRELPHEDDEAWEPPLPVAVELYDPVARIAKVPDLETGRMEHRLVAGMIVSSDKDGFNVVYEDDQELVLKRTDAEEGRLLHGVYAQFSAQGIDLNEYIAQRHRDLRHGRSSVSGPEGAGPRHGSRDWKSVVAAEDVSEGNIIQGKRKRRANIETGGGMLGLGIMGDRAPVTFGGLTETDDNEADDEDYVPSRKDE